MNTAKQINDPQTGALELAPREALPVARTAPQLNLQPIAILEKAIQGGVTKENVEVVKELLAMVREQRADESKAAFAAAYFQLRKNMPVIYADREAKNNAGKVTFSYCSEEEITKKLEPHLTSYGFCMLFSQQKNGNNITAKVTLIHERGHQEPMEYTVQAGQPNGMKDAAMCDTGGATTAWRHLMIKTFGLKSRIQEGSDAKNIGAFIDPETALDLQRRAFDTGSDVLNFLRFAGVPLPDTADADAIKAAFGRIGTAKLPALEAALKRKESTK